MTDRMTTPGSAGFFFRMRAIRVISGQNMPFPTYALQLFPSAFISVNLWFLLPEWWNRRWTQRNTDEGRSSPKRPELDR